DAGAPDAGADEAGADEAGKPGVAAGFVGEAVAEPLGERGAERLGVGDAAGADGDEEEAEGPLPEGPGPEGSAPSAPPWHGAPLMVQAAGWPAGPADWVTKPTVTDPPGAIAASQPSLFTVTWPPLSVYEPSHREEIAVPLGSVNVSVQPFTAAVPGLVIVYWPL